VTTKGEHKRKRQNEIRTVAYILKPSNSEEIYMYLVVSKVRSIAILLFFTI